MATLKPIKRRLYCRKCHSGEKKIDKDGSVHYEVGGITVTDKRGHYSPYWEIMDVSDDCRLFSKADIGKIVRLPIWNEAYMRNVVPKKSVVVKEQMFEDGAAPACVIIP
jgi:hypothetical protein